MLVFHSKGKKNPKCQCVPLNMQANSREHKYSMCAVSDYMVILTIIVRLQEHLNDTETASSKIEQHIANAPAFCALSLVVHVGLKNSMMIISHQTIYTLIL